MPIEKLAKTKKYEFGVNKVVDYLGMRLRPSKTYVMTGSAIQALEKENKGCINQDVLREKG